jgi:hypothetical protein
MHQQSSIMSTSPLWVHKQDKKINMLCTDDQSRRMINDLLQILKEKEIIPLICRDLHFLSSYSWNYTSEILKLWMLLACCLLAWGSAGAEIGRTGELMLLACCWWTKLNKKIFTVSCCLLTHARIGRKAYHVGACCLLLLAWCRTRPPRVSLPGATRSWSRPPLLRACGADSC